MTFRSQVASWKFFTFRSSIPSLKDRTYFRNTLYKKLSLFPSATQLSRKNLCNYLQPLLIVYRIIHFTHTTVVCTNKRLLIFSNGNLTNYKPSSFGINIKYLILKLLTVKKSKALSYIIFRHPLIHLFNLF